MTIKKRGKPNHLLRQARDAEKLTQQELADKIGTTVINIGRWERGEVFPSPYFRSMLCKFFNKSDEQLGLIRTHYLYTSDEDDKHYIRNNEFVMEKGALFELQNTLPFILVLEEVPIYALMSHFAKKLSGRVRNDVHLDLLQVSIKVHGTERTKDATLAWRFKGKNTQNRSISGFYSAIAGENATPFSELECSVFDLLPDGSRGEPRVPQLLSTDSNHKDLLLPFQAPGILPGQAFDIELTYTWPSIVNPLKDYWFAEPRTYANQVKEFRFLFEYPAKSVRAASAFQLSSEDRKVTFIGSLPVNRNGADTFRYETIMVENGKIYLVVVETNAR